MMSKSDPSSPSRKPPAKPPAADEVRLPVVPYREFPMAPAFPGEIPKPDYAAVEFLANLLPTMETILTENVSRKSAAFGNRA